MILSNTRLDHNSRAVPLHGNSVMRVDPVTKDVGLSDLVGGSSVFYGTKEKLVKV